LNPTAITERSARRRRRRRRRTGEERGKGSRRGEVMRSFETEKSCILGD
jgi:hypothetical protein